MARNLDITALRSFVAVADAGGVTRAAGFLNLTQSAVSMQIKRLEEMLQVKLLNRVSRTVTLTPEGEQLLSYARRILEMNDELLARLTAQEFEGSITLGVPHDIVYPVVPEVLRRFNEEFPRVEVKLLASYTGILREQFGRGEVDLILTTENELREGGEMLVEVPLTWVGAIGGKAWKARPLRLAFEPHCRFRGVALAELDKAGIEWEMLIQDESERVIEASISADLAIHAVLEGAEGRNCARVQDNGALPRLPMTMINMYMSKVTRGPLTLRLAELMREGYMKNARGAVATPSHANDDFASRPARAEHL